MSEKKPQESAAPPQDSPDVAELRAQLAELQRENAELRAAKAPEAAAPEAPKATERMHAPKGVSSFSFDGVEYRVKNGAIVVPPAAVADAEVFGFVVDRS